MWRKRKSKAAHNDLYGEVTMVLERGMDFVHYFFETPREYRALLYAAHKAQRNIEAMTVYDEEKKKGKDS